MIGNLVKFTPETDLFYAIHSLTRHHLPGAPVVDSRDQLLGMLSEYDCLNAVLTDGYHEQAGGKVGSYMTTQYQFLSPNDNLLTAAERFIKEHYQMLPVLQEGRLVGQLNQHNILTAIKDFSTDCC
jgi:CBS domain-containing protein